MKRRSSKGNPYHVPKGSPKGGQFTTKGNGVEVVRNGDYYEAKTRLRTGEISEDTFRDMIKKENSTSRTPEYDAFVRSLPKQPDVSTIQAKRALFKQVTNAAGVECRVPIRKTKGKQKTGSCKIDIQIGGDGIRKKMKSVTLSSQYDEDRQRDTLYHEAYHFCSNGGLTSSYDYYKNKIITNERDSSIEETMAVCSAHALCVDTGCETSNPTYAPDLAGKLPRLKHNTEQFSECNTIADVGRIAWNERIRNKNSMWDELGDEMYSKPLPWNYYHPYIEYIQQNREAIVDDLCVRYGSPNDPEARRIITESLMDGCKTASHGTVPYEHNARLTFCDALMYGFRDMGIL